MAQPLGTGSPSLQGTGSPAFTLLTALAEHREIAELDINPLIVYPWGKGCVVADSRILLANPGSR